MSQSENRKNVAQLVDALRALDALLTEQDLSIEIKAMGGFALLQHGVRTGDRAYTADIDTVTPDYPATVVALIERVAEEQNLDNDWLNNYGVMGDVDLIEQMIDAEWERSDLSDEFTSIELSIATLGTLTRAKRLATEDAELSGRAQDAPDLIELVAHQGITSIAQYDARFPDEWDEYPEARETVRRWLARD